MTGFSLIEVLVALLVAAVGVLGLVAVQALCLQTSRAALERVDAVLLAYDVLDRMRANPAGTPPGAAYALGAGAGPPATTDCRAADCSVAQMVAFDQASWKCALGAFHDAAVCGSLRSMGVVSGTAGARLPQGDGSVALDGAALRVTVRWMGMDRAPQAVVVSSRP